MQIPRTCLIAGLLAVPLLGQSRAATFSNNFNSSTTPPAGSYVNGSTVIEATGGVENSGVLKITKNLNSQSGSFVIEDLDAGAAVYGFELAAKVRVGGGTGTPADGFSINFDPTAGPTSVTGEEGTAGGITFAFDIFDNGNETPPAPSIDLKVGGQLVATSKMSIADFDTGTGYADLSIRVAPDGAVSLSWKGVERFSNIYFPGYQPLSFGHLVIGGRTGGLNVNQWIDDLTFTTYTQPQVGFAVQPRSASVVAGQNVTLAPTLNNPDGATFQWFRNGTEITGATSQNLELPNVTTGLSGSRYTLRVTGPNNTVTSQEAVLIVRDIPGPVNPQVNLDFNTTTLPEGVTLFNNEGGFAAGYISASGGVGDSGVLHLTDALGGLAGGIVINDPNAGQPVYGFTARFDALVGGGTATPADGFSFSFGNDIADLPAGALEEGLGSGIRVAFDTYNNGGGEAPAVDVFYGSTLIASTKVPISSLLTEGAYVPVLIRVENDGTIDVAYNGVLLHDNLPVPQFSSITGGRFALGARTGGLDANHWIDNLQISVSSTPGDLRITTQPLARRVVVGDPATFTTDVNDPAGVTFQWYRNGQAIGGATSSTYTIPSTVAGDTGALFKVEARRGNLVVMSDEVALTILDLTRPANPTVSYNFNDGQTPAGTILANNNDPLQGPWAGYITTSGGVGDSGVLHLVDAINSASGAFIIPAQQGGAELGSFTAAFDVFVGGGTATPADGFAFSFGPDITEGTVGEAENGSGTGLTIAFDIYNNGNETPPAPSVDVRWKGQVVASVQLPFAEIRTDGTFREVLIRLNEGGTVDVAYGDRVLFQGVQLPNYAPITGGKFGFYARTGGANENVWIDNIAILATKSTAPLRLTQDISNVNLLPGNTTSFTVNVSDPNGVTYQWFRNGVAIQGATGATYTPAAFTPGEDGDRFHVVATGPGGTATSSTAVVTVVSPITIANPDLSIDFNDGTVPAGVTVNSSAGGGYIGTDGILHLTDALNGQQGSIVITDLDAGEAVNGFTAKFKLLVGGGSNPPADGLSFVWVNDLPETTIFGEDGSGTGLVISFDIYDNSNETPPAPSIDVRYNGTTVGTVKRSFAQMRTGDVFADFIVRVEPDGTLDLHYKNEVLFHNLQLPGFVAPTGASFGIGARTGGLNENQWVDDLMIVTTTGAAAPRLSIARNGANFQISWTGAGRLESAPSVLGPWNPVQGGTTSPVSVPNNGTMEFFRVVQPAQ